MARIHRELQHRLNKVVTGTASALCVFSTAVCEAALDAQDLAAELDTAAKEKAAVVAANAIEMARK